MDTFKINRGINISHWLSQSTRRGAERLAWFTANDVKLIASLGFDHIRLPVDEEQLWDEKGNREEEAFALLHDAIKWCSDNSLRVIVDLHIIRSHHFNLPGKTLWVDPAEQDKLVNLWEQLSDELGDYPNGLVAYEIMNEAVADDPDDWNRLLGRTISKIREKEPERTIVAGSNMWQSVNTFPDLVIPANDENLILSFHFYLPFAFTHYKAGWTDLKDYTGSVHYPGEIISTDELSMQPEEIQKKLQWVEFNYNRDSMIADIQTPVKYAKSHRLSLYCGEFGCYPTVDHDERLLWYRDFRSALEEYGISWAAWDYKGGFGIVDREGKPYKDLVKALIPEK